MDLINWLSDIECNLVFFTFTMDCNGHAVKITTDVEPTKAYEAELHTYIRSIENALATKSPNLGTNSN